MYFCHSHDNFNVLRVGYGKAMQTVMQAEWLACFWCISNQDEVPGLPGYNIIMKYFHFRSYYSFIIGCICDVFFSFIYATDVILTKF